MPTLLDLVVTFLRSVVRLIVVFTTEVALRQPIDLLALVSLAAGTVLTVVPTAVFGYLVAGAALDAIGVDPTALVRSPPEER